MRHQRRLSFKKKGEREQFKSPLLPYPERTSKIYSKKCDLYPEFMFCIPAKPISNVFGYDLDMFVKSTTIISISIWVTTLFLEGFFFYRQGLELKSNILLIFVLFTGIIIFLVGSFCGVIGFIGCSIPNSACIYTYYLQVTIQIIVNIYAITASLIRGYFSYTLVYSLFLALDALFLFPTWSLYIYTKLDGAPPNAAKYGGLLSELLSACEYKDGGKSNPDDSDKNIENGNSEASNKIPNRPSTFNTKAILYKPNIKDKKQTRFLVGDNTNKQHKSPTIKSPAKDENVIFVPLSSVSSKKEREFEENSNFTNPEIHIEIPDVKATQDTEKVNGEKKSTFSWLKPSVSIGRR
ncbi:hypothetical protein FG379_003138 [Cryptosporidium bovis]|uniref:uncharacterized protein n=1 Tax=Cryptosporidium bovis TaxID=310047 RepID=UPI003519DCB6|nr:hypothetical protein FG379_003138 [Cryptosporidium bovis]